MVLYSVRMVPYGVSMVPLSVRIITYSVNIGWQDVNIVNPSARMFIHMLSCRFSINCVCMVSV